MESEVSVCQGCGRISGEAAALQVERGGAVGHCAELVEERDRLMLRRAVVVVVGGEARKMRAEVRLADPPVEVDEVGMVALDDLRRTREPVIHEGRRDIGEIVAQQVAVFAIQLAKLRRAVEGGVLRIVHIGGEVAASIEKPVVLGAMRRCAEVHAFCANRFCEVAEHIALRSHLARAPVGEIRLIHGKAVMVFGDRDDVARAGIVKELCPRIRIEVLGGELRDQVLVAETGLRAVSGDVVREVRHVLLIHVARVPLAAEAGDGVHAPMDEDAKLGIAKPFRRLIRAQALPVIAERPCGDGLVHVGKDALALAIVFTVRGDPLRIDLLRRERACGGSGRIRRLR